VACAFHSSHACALTDRSSTVSYLLLTENAPVCSPKMHLCSRLMHGRWEADPDAGHIREFFRLLAVCHTVIPEGPPTPTEIRYQVLQNSLANRRPAAAYRHHTTVSRGLSYVRFCRRGHQMRRPWWWRPRSSASSSTPAPCAASRQAAGLTESLRFCHDYCPRGMDWRSTASAGWSQTSAGWSRRQLATQRMVTE
jgi:hypothetical protein